MIIRKVPLWNKKTCNRYKNALEKLAIQITYQHRGQFSRDLRLFRRMKRLYPTTLKNSRRMGRVIKKERYIISTSI